MSAALEFAYSPEDLEEVAGAVAAYQAFARNNRLEYSRLVLGYEPWNKQAQILQAVSDPDVTYVSVRSGNGVGKTFMFGDLICNYLDTHCPGIAVLSGASWRSVTKTVWPNFRRMLRNARVPLGGKVLDTEWRRDNQGLWGAFIVSPDQPESFAGYRNENGVFIGVDEASALKRSVHDAIMGVASAEGSKVFYSGNPLHATGPFRDTFNNPDWVNFHIDSHEVVDLGIPGLASKKWIESRKREWGEDSPIYKARVLGWFPEDDDHTLILMRWVVRVLSKPKVAIKSEERGPRRLGVDVARYGGDRTTFVIRDNREVLLAESETKRSTMWTVGKLRSLSSKYDIDPSHIFVDDTGLGGGVTDRARELDMAVCAVNFGEAALDKDQFFNRRSELYWRLRNRFDPEKKANFHIPEKYKSLAKECAWAKYTLTSDGRIKLEPKEDIKKRHGRSPDWADALALTEAEPGQGFSIEWA